MVEASADVPSYKLEDIGRFIEYIEEARLRIKQKMSVEYAMKDLLLKITK